MKRLLLVLGFATVLNACGGKDDPPPLSKPTLTGGSTSNTGGRSGTGGADAGVLDGGLGDAGIGGAATGGASSSMATTGGTSGVGGDTSASAGQSAGGTSGTDDAGVQPDAGPPNEGPIVTITNPSTSLATPDEPGTIVDSAFDVLCTVQKSPAVGAADVSGSSIKIDVLDASGIVVPNQPSVPATATGNPNQYKAKFTFSNTIVIPGRITFRCSASDQSTTPLTATDSVSTYVDYGPDIGYVLPPKDMAAYPLNSVVPFEIQVDPHPLDTTDLASALENVSLRVYTTDIAVTKNSQGRFVAQVDFSDHAQFPDGLSGVVAASVTASNGRKPVSAISVRPINIVLDGTSPVIKIIDPTPPPNAIVGGLQKICFNVNDGNGSGVNQNTITIKLDTTAYAYLEPLPNLWSSTAAGDYCFQFNSADFPNSQAQVTVSLAATDNAGNVAPLETRQFHLDNIPPFVSLDPPLIRIISHPNSSTTNCSIPFDPIGPKAANAGSLQLSSSGYVRFRAFVWELANSPQGVDTVWISGVNDKNVHLYMRPWIDDSTPPVVIDANKDPYNICDQVDPDLKKSTNSAQTQMMPLTASAGSPDYSGKDFTSAPNIESRSCTPTGTPPDLLCGKTSDMTFVTREPIATAAGSSLNLSTVYAINVDASLLCTGDQWDISSAGGIPDGWVCVVAEAPDFAGNIGVSAPIPICLDHTNGVSPPECAITSAAPPNCATGCKPISRSLVGDIDSGGTAVPYDVGNPQPFVVEYLN